MKLKINPKEGIGELLFGMKQPHVENILGKPDTQYKDEDKNIIYLYNAYKLRLTFYEDEDFRLGYMVTSHPDAELFGAQVIGKNTKEVLSQIPQKLVKEWENSYDEGLLNVFNEDNWIMLISEFDEIVKVEVGAIINRNDEFDWKFKL